MRHTGLVLCACAAVLGGCVSKGKYLTLMGSAASSEALARTLEQDLADSYRARDAQAERLSELSENVQHLLQQSQSEATLQLDGTQRLYDQVRGLEHSLRLVQSRYDSCLAAYTEDVDRNTERARRLEVIHASIERALSAVPHEQSDLLRERGRIILRLSPKLLTSPRDARELSEFGKAMLQRVTEAAITMRDVELQLRVAQMSSQTPYESRRVSPDWALGMHASTYLTDDLRISRERISIGALPLDATAGHSGVPSERVQARSAGWLTLVFMLPY